MKMIENLKVGIIFIFSVSIGLSQDKLINVHDPVAIEDNGLYHIFSTGKGISHFVSSDMRNWKNIGPIFKEKPIWADQVVIDFKNHIWAPDIVYHNEKYYLFYSISSFGKNTSAIGVTLNKTLDTLNADYEWKDQGIVVRSYPNRDLWNAIDPNIVFDENGKGWMTFGSFWDGIKMVKLNDELLSISEPQEWFTLARRSRSFELKDSDPGDAHIEAPFIFKKNGYYYLFVSWDLCCRGKESTYKVVVGRSQNITGPYLDKDGKDLFNGGGSLVVEGNKRWYGAGHNSIYTFDKEDYFIFHAYDSMDEGKSKLKISKMLWDDNFWPIQILNY